ncbi:MAG: polysaccharide biosynthesis/export family protein, partial [Planctomycetes bacterium]|nr:polysaccharide biosynthesis/export family protein [Planctomycetota bacterium]
MKDARRSVRGWNVLCLAVLPALAGCVGPAADWWKTDATRFLSPEKVIKKPQVSPINPILSSIGPTDRAQEIVPNATFPRDEDLEYSDQDYVIGPTDVLDISVLDLFSDGLETVLRRQVSESGYIDLPLLPQRIKAEGYTKDELKRVIADAYSPNVLRNPTVSVTIAARRQNTFSVLGAVNRPGTYNVLRKDMRLLEALALAGGITQTNIHYIYVIRPKPPIRRRSVRTGGGQLKPSELPPLPPEAPGPGAGPATRPAEPKSRPAGQNADAALRELESALEGGLGPRTKPA